MTSQEKLQKLEEAKELKPEKEKEPWEMTQEEYRKIHKKVGTAGTWSFYPGYSEGGMFGLPKELIPEIYNDLDKTGIEWRFSKKSKDRIIPKRVGQKFTKEEEAKIKNIFEQHGGFASKEIIEGDIKEGMGFRIGHWDVNIYDKRHQKIIQQALSEGKLSYEQAEKLGHFENYSELKKKVEGKNEESKGKKIIA